MLNLTKRPCHIGNSMSTNCEKHGDEDVGAIDLPLTGIILKRDELDALLGASAFDAFYCKPKSNGSNNELVELRFPQIKPIQFKDHFEKARVEIWLGFDDGEDAKIGLSDCKVRNVTLTPQTGGMTMLSCSVRATPEDEVVSQLFNFLNHDASVGIRNGKVAEPKAKSKQKDLALGEPGDDSGEEATA